MPDTLELTVRDFVHQLAAEQPTPGGGSAASLVGALGASLVSMVCRYTAGREKYRDSEERATALLARAEELRAALTDATEADVAAFGAYSEAQKMPRDTDEQKAARAAKQQEALRASTQVPLGVAEQSAEVVSLAREAAAIGNPFLISDAGVAASLGLAAFESAVLNVELNAGGLDDRDFAADALERVRAAGGAEGHLRGLVDQTYATIRSRTG
jgi:formiminotetrahydrofolate cyclodeaminase